VRSAMLRQINREWLVDYVLASRMAQVQSLQG
jgi:hypothetical protein